MTKYVKAHSKYILEQIKSGSITEDILAYHRLQIQNIQHERLIHLIVLCLFALLMVGSLVFYFIMTSIITFILMGIFLATEFFYILHYYLLENTVQMWYRLENDMIASLKNIGTNTSEKKK
ncbi:MAG: hypothetical protein AB1Z23_03285 [Eubacteriales bacterium]